MSHEEIQSIKDEMKQNHAEMMDKMTALQMKVQPVCDLYNDMSGTAKVIKWVFAVVLGIASLIGAVKLILSLK